MGLRSHFYFRMAPRFQYTEEAMMKAVNAVNNGVSVRRAAIMFGVPRVTLLDKVRGRSPAIRKMGPSTILTEGEENKLVQWMLSLGKAGFPVTKSQLLNSVSVLTKKLGRNTPFKQGQPGRHWYESFLKRHRNISERISESVSACRALVTEKSIRRWFEEVATYLDQNKLRDIGLMEDPSRMFNCDETAFFLSPKENKVLAQKGSKIIYNKTSAGEKENVTTLIMVNAAGRIGPPAVVLKFKRIPKHVADSIPETWGVGRSDNGW